MKDTVTREKTMTVREVAKITGAAYSTVAAYAQKAGWTQNGKITLLNEKQATVIVEAMKNAHGGGRNGGSFQTSLEGIETKLSPVLQLKLIQEQKDALHAQEIAIYQAELNRVEAAFCREVIEHNQTKTLLTERETGLSIIQRIAESGGIVLSDRDDLVSAYRGYR